MLRSLAPFGGVVHVSVGEDDARSAVTHALGGGLARHILVTRADPFDTEVA